MDAAISMASMASSTQPINADAAWAAVEKRDVQADGRFVYAVSSTGVYCRPSCPSRRPARRHVEFYAKPLEAESAGYRACLRCRPTQEDPPPAAHVHTAHRDDPKGICRCDPRGAAQESPATILERHRRDL